MLHRLQLRRPKHPNAVILSLNPTLASNEEPGRGLTQFDSPPPAIPPSPISTAPSSALLPAHAASADRRRRRARDSEIALYRGEEPQAYRIDIYPVAADGTTSLGRVALLLTVETDGASAATGGQLTLLDACSGGATSGCSNAAVPVQVFLFPPVFAGTQVRLSTAATVTLNATPGATGATPVEIDFGQLLAGTTWNG